MPSGDEIQASLAGAWRLMLGKADGLRQLDLSADGFWNSFYALVVAFPASFAVWTAQAVELEPGAGSFAARTGLVLRLAIIEVFAWMLPLIVIGYVLTRVGKGERFVPFFVANNWASVWLTWLTMPALVVMSLFPGLADMMTLIVLLLLFAQLFFLWRLNNAILSDAPVATAVVATMLVLTMLIYSGLNWLLSMPSPPEIG